MPREDRTENTQTPEEALAMSWVQHILASLRLTLVLTASETHMIKQALLPVFISLISKDPKTLAAGALIPAFIDAVMISCLAPIFDIGLEGAPLAADWDRVNGRVTMTEAGLLQRDETIRGLTNLFRTGILYTAFSPLVMLPFLVSEPVFLRLGQNPDTARIAGRFLRNYSFSIPLTFYNNILVQLFQCFQFEPALRMASGSLAIGLGLSAFLIFYADLQEEGILIGYLTEPVITALSLTAILRLHPKFREIPFFSQLTHRLKEIIPAGIRFLSNGGWITLSILIEMCLTFGASVIAGRQGIEQQALLATGMPLFLGSGIIAINSAVAAMLRLGRALGSHSTLYLRRVSDAGIIACMGAGAVIPLICSLFPEILMGLEGQADESTYTTLRWFIPYLSLAAVFDVFNFSLLFQLRMLGNMRSSSLVYIGSKILGLIISLIIGLGFPETGVYGATSGLLVSGIINALLFRFMLTGEIEGYSFESSKSHQPEFPLDIEAQPTNPPVARMWCSLFHANKAECVLGLSPGAEGVILNV